MLIEGESADDEHDGGDDVVPTPVVSVSVVDDDVSRRGKGPVPTIKSPLISLTGGHIGVISCAVFCGYSRGVGTGGDDDKIVSGGWDKDVVLWNLDSGRGIL